MRSSPRFSSLVALLGLAATTSGYAPNPDYGHEAAADLAASAAGSAVSQDAGAVLLERDLPLIRSSDARDATSTHVAFLPPRRLLPADPRTATRRAYFFPGGGHFYTGETTRGAALLGVAAGSVLAGALLSSSGGSCTPTAPGDGCVYDPETHRYRGGSPNRAPLYVGAAVAAASWIYGVVDARHSAARMNGRHAVALGPVTAHPAPLVGVDDRGRAQLGATLRLAR